MAIEKSNEIKKKHKAKRGKIVFDDEIITKDAAATLIQKGDGNEQLIKRQKKSEKIGNAVQNNSSEINLTEHKNKRKAHKKKQVSDINSDKAALSNKTCVESSPKRKHMELLDNEETAVTPDPENDDKTANSSSLDAKKEESIRARKKRRHLELLQEKKLHNELNFQQKCLNYLSMWKHGKSQWKFEKLKQIWLQQNMFDDVKVPEEFWDTLVEYFNNAKGQAKSNILSEAVKIVDSVEDVDDDSLEKNVKYIRARNIVQNLQE